MKIAIIGAGFAGLATAWHLLQLQEKIPLEITIFDSIGVGGGASGIAAGLIHPFTGQHAKLNRFGFEGYEEASILLNAAQKMVPNKIFKKTPLLRVCLSKQQEEDFLKCALNYEGVQFLNAAECQRLIPSLSPHPGILIHDTKTAYAKPYLESLFLACMALNAKFEQTKINDLNELKSFTHVVVTAGKEITRFKELRDLGLSFTKGQILTLEWPKDLPKIPFALNSQSYLIMNQDEKSCIAGATFERNYLSDAPDQRKAEAEIMPKIEALIPGLKNAKIINCQAAFRVSSKNHLPLIQEINPRLYIFTGLGSKGLLYHGLYAKKLCEMITRPRFLQMNICNLTSI